MTSVSFVYIDGDGDYVEIEATAYDPFMEDFEVEATDQAGNTVEPTSDMCEEAQRELLGIRRSPEEMDNE